MALPMHVPKKAVVGVSRVSIVVVVVVIIALAGGAAYFVSSLSSSSSTSSSNLTSTSSSESSSTTFSSSSSLTSSAAQSSQSSGSSSLVSSSSVTALSSSTTNSPTCTPPASSTVPAGTSLVSVHVGFTAPAIQEAPLAIAQNLSIFAEFGLQVTYGLVHSNALQIALQSGQIQFAYGNDATSFLVAVAAGINETAVMMNDPAGLPYYFIVHPSITSAQQIASLASQGKPISVAENGPANSSSDEAIAFIFNIMGLKPDQVKHTYFSSNNIALQAFLAGQTDAVIATPPRALLAFDSGDKQLGPVASSAGFIRPDVQSVTPSYLAANPGVVSNFLKALLVATCMVATWPNPALSAATNDAILSTTSAFVGFNTTLTQQSLMLYHEDRIFGPTGLPNASSLQFAYDNALIQSPQVLYLNLNSPNIYNWNIIQSLQPFADSLWGGKAPSEA